METMEVRHAIHPDQAKQLNTNELRTSFLVDGLFNPGRVKLVYGYYDRLMVGGVQPDKEVVQLEVDEKFIGAEFLLERRELGVINIGQSGSVAIDGTDYPLGNRDALYVGMGAKSLRFSSADAGKPAKFYLLSAPAHRSYPITRITIADSEPNRLGSDEQSNRRTIYKYIHPDGVKSCQLVMGLTMLEPKNVWNTMPSHTHARRIEAYLYFDFPSDNIVFHFMGLPEETRHLIVRSEQAVLSPSWSLHSGVGTTNYSFIWGMAGENQTFSDMDAIPMDSLR